MLDKDKMISGLKKFWHFIWEEDSLASWIANVIIAFVLVKFIIYPLLGLMLSTSYPVVAVVSGSMEHNGLGFEAWWANSREWYETNGFSKEEFRESKLKNGFNKGDIILLVGTKPEKIKKGDIIVYSNERYKYPIIHRVTEKRDEGGKYYFTTKGDNNGVQDPEEINEGQLIGRTVIKVPLLGWIKIIFTKLVGG